MNARRLGPNVTLAIARASRNGNPRAAKVAELPQAELAAYIRDHLPRNPWTQCLASTDTTTEQAAQARHDLGLALEHMDSDPGFVAMLLKDSDV